MKNIILIFALQITGCTILPKIDFSNDRYDKINELNYMKTPCFLDGIVLKKKPKVVNID